MLKVIEISELKSGMFVTRVVKQEGKFYVTSGGRIKKQDDINKLVAKGIIQVEIDLKKSMFDKNKNLSLGSDESNQDYGKQLEHSLKIYEQAKDIHSRLMTRVAMGKVADLQSVNEVSQHLLERVFEHEDAISIVTLLSENDQYFIEHSVNCAILIILFARHLGFEPELMRQLGAGAMLMDIGMMKLPLLLTEKPEHFSQTDTQKMQKHVKIALDLVDKIDAISEVSKEVIELHHERLDGSGYPAKLTEQHISVYGRMAAIVDVYDSLTTKRPHRSAHKPADALRLMAEEIPGLDQQLFKEFVLCIGANPVGSLVKLDSEKLAMVLRRNKRDPLNPVVMVFYDLQTKISAEPYPLDLAKSDDVIAASINPDDFGMNLQQFLLKTFI
ncbi:HD domain-containing phosphohydrolase [Paraglaciecola sp. 25GB23A]|uniref:HD-GYP domain-containing protein n=1 Tax=Paraglaciecola sp. 25GB23A TaxID=3156068 RepID=UPI0032AF81B5